MNNSDSDLNQIELPRLINIDLLLLFQPPRSSITITTSEIESNTSSYDMDDNELGSSLNSTLTDPTNTSVSDSAINYTSDITLDNDKLDEPLNKKQKIGQQNASNVTNPKKLEDRLCNILVCCVCLDGSKSSIYQV